MKTFSSPTTIKNAFENTLVIWRPGAMIEYAWMEETRALCVTAYDDLSGDPHPMDHLDFSTEEQSALTHFFNTINTIAA